MHQIWIQTESPRKIISIEPMKMTETISWIKIWSCLTEALWIVPDQEIWEQIVLRIVGDNAVGKEGIQIWIRKRLDRRRIRRIRRLWAIDWHHQVVRLCISKLKIRTMVSKHNHQNKTKAKTLNFRHRSPSINFKKWQTQKRRIQSWISSPWICNNNPTSSNRDSSISTNNWAPADTAQATQSQLACSQTPSEELTEAQRPPRANSHTKETTEATTAVQAWFIPRVCWRAQEK